MAAVSLILLEFRVDLVLGLLASTGSTEPKGL